MTVSVIEHPETSETPMETISAEDPKAPDAPAEVLPEVPGSVEQAAPAEPVVLELPDVPDPPTLDCYL